MDVCTHTDNGTWCLIPYLWIHVHMHVDLNDILLVDLICIVIYWNLLLLTSTIETEANIYPIFYGFFNEGFIKSIIRFLDGLIFNLMNGLFCLNMWQDYLGAGLIVIAYDCIWSPKYRSGSTIKKDPGSLWIKCNSFLLVSPLINGFFLIKIAEELGSIFKELIYL